MYIYFTFRFELNCIIGPIKWAWMLVSMFPTDYIDIHPSGLAIIFDLGQSALFEFLILCYRFMDFLSE